MLRSIVVMFCWTSISWTALSGQTRFVHALNEHGRVIINGTPFHNLPASFDPSNVDDRRDNRRWADQVVRGNDHFHLRRDGRITKNGINLRRAPRNEGRWVRLAVDSNGTTYCLGRRGRIARDDAWLYALPVVPSEERLFDEFVLHDGSLYSLRRDGLVFVNGNGAPTWTLPSGGTGLTSEERWRDLAADAATGALYALRQDGLVFRMTMGNAPFGELVIDLPDDGTRRQFRALAIDENGAWIALREDGVIFQDTTGATPVVDYPGEGRFEDDDFHDLVAFQGSYYAMRWDGPVFCDGNLDPVFDARGTRYVRLAVSDQTPDTSALREFPTRIARTRVTAYVGDTVSLPLWVTDVDDARDTLTVEIVELPAGATFDAQTFLITWPGAALGKHRAVLTVSDDRKARRVTVPLRILPRTTAGNQAPVFPSLSTLQVFRGREFVLHHQAHDADGDVLTYVPRELPAWLIFDEPTTTLRGTPPLDQDRPLRITIEAHDGRGGVARSRLRMKFVDAFHFGAN
ncbi:MAG: hypothetical protein H6834_09340 [Planctomycetes bacterium]|nr:hypothetical protein [Planctomycetota bacterium]